MANLFQQGHPFIGMLAADKARGAIIGGALGDAIGLYTEFLPSERAKQVYPEGIEFGKTPFCSDSHRDKFSKGSWTDDTDHALLLVLSFLDYYNSEHKSPTVSHIAQDFAARLRCWCDQGLLALSTPPLGIGQTIGTIALLPTFLDNPKAHATEIWSRSSINTKPASNGSLMRAHPLGIIAATLETDKEAFELAIEVSRTTHADPRCSLACCALVGILRGIIRGDIVDESGLDQMLLRCTEFMLVAPQLWLPESATESPATYLRLDEFDAHVNSSATFETLQLDEARKIGYIYKCLGSGIVALRRAMRITPNPSKTIFEDEMLSLVMQGGDADTNGAVAGSLLGAWFGQSSLPTAWTEKLHHRDWLQKKTTRFVYATGIEDRMGKDAWKAETKDTDTDINGGRTPFTKEEIYERDVALFNAILANRKAENAASSGTGWMSVFRKSGK